MDEGGAVDDVLGRAKKGGAPLVDRGDAPVHRFGRIGQCGEDLEKLQVAGFAVEQHEIGKRSADITAQSEHRLRPILSRCPASPHLLVFVPVGSSRRGRDKLSGSPARPRASGVPGQEGGSVMDGTGQVRLPEGRFDGYEKSSRPPEDAVLTRVGPGTPCGEYWRRFWFPVAMTREVTDVPLRIRILGEDLILFRDGSGRHGLLQLHCSHRNTSLEFGLIEERGISCCYHGWHYDIDGTILATPGDADSGVKNRVRHGALSGHRIQGPDLRLSGTAGRDAAVPRIRLLRTSRRRDGALLDRHAVQLAPGGREHDGSHARGVPPLPRTGHAFRFDLGANCR